MSNRHKTPLSTGLDRGLVYTRAPDVFAGSNMGTPAYADERKGPPCTNVHLCLPCGHPYIQRDRR